MSFPTLTTQRLVLRELLPTDAADVLTFRGDPEVQKYDDPPLHTLAEAGDFIAELRQACASNELQTWAVTVAGSDTVLGLVTLQFWKHTGNRYHHRAEVGYGIARAAWGRGSAPKRCVPLWSMALSSCGSTASLPTRLPTTLPRYGCWKSLGLRVKGRAGNTRSRTTA